MDENEKADGGGGVEKLLHALLLFTERGGRFRVTIHSQKLDHTLSVKDRATPESRGTAFAYIRAQKQDQLPLKLNGLIVDFADFEI